MWIISKKSLTLLVSIVFLVNTSFTSLREKSFAGSSSVPSLTTVSCLQDSYGFIKEIADSDGERDIKSDLYFRIFCGLVVEELKNFEEQGNFKDIENIVGECINYIVNRYIEKYPEIYSCLNEDRRFNSIWYSMYWRFNSEARKYGLVEYLFPATTLGKDIYAKHLKEFI